MRPCLRPSARASRLATRPMLHDKFGMICWLRASIAACTGSERLMRKNAARERPRGRYLPPDTDQRMVSAIAPDVLDQQFRAPRPNAKWIADFTYIWTAEGRLYVAAVIDLFSRRVVGWSMSKSMTAQRVTDALLMAIWRRGKPDALLHHSDQGGQYTSEQFRLLLDDNGGSCSIAGQATSGTMRRWKASSRRSNRTNSTQGLSNQGPSQSRRVRLH